MPNTMPPATVNVQLFGLAYPISRHGVRDRHVPANMSECYAEAAQAAGDPVDLAVRHDVGHMDLIEPRSPGWSVALDFLLRSSC